MRIPTVVQHRHVHLSEQDRITLFGEETLTPRRTLSHQGQFVAQQSVQIIGPNGTFERVCVLGPERDETQVELSSSDGFAIGLDAPLRVSGDVNRSASCVIKGPAGEMKATYTTIVPARHVHLTPAAAKQFGLSHLDIISLTSEVDGGSIEHVVVRVHPTFAIEFHITKDEAAQWWLQTGDYVKIS